MEPETTAEMQALEARLNADPTSEPARQEILLAYLADGFAGHPRRIHHIVEYLRQFPRTIVARCPFVHVDADAFPDAFTTIERIWLQLQLAYPVDPEIAQGFAAFVAVSDRPRALKILDQALNANPDEPGVWLEIGRIHPDPSQSLHALEKAHSLGALHPNLLTWIARAAIDARDREAAERVAAELLALITKARSVYGEMLDWPERGRALWQRARATTDSDGGARRIAAAVADHANRKHWVHTTLGVLAARAGDLSAACDHLSESVALVGDHRLSSYGPSFKLARELCTLDKRDAVRDYLTACERFWNVELLRTWRHELDHQQVPDFPDQ